MNASVKNTYPSWVCSDCGIEANRLTCLAKYGKEPLKKCFDVSTFHDGTCDVCGKYTSVTEPRDFFDPDFELLKIKAFNLYKKIKFLRKKYVGGGAMGDMFEEEVNDLIEEALNDK